MPLQEENIVTVCEKQKGCGASWGKFSWRCGSCRQGYRGKTVEKSQTWWWKEKEASVMRGKMFYLETESQHSVITSGEKNNDPFPVLHHFIQRKKWSNPWFFHTFNRVFNRICGDGGGKSGKHHITTGIIHRCHRGIIVKSSEMLHKLDGENGKMGYKIHIRDRK